MIMTLVNEILTIQAQQPPATTRPATPNPNPATNQELQDAARDLREAIRNNVRREIDAAARAQAAQGATRAQAAQGATPPPTPDGPRTFTIRGPDGRQTIIGVPATPFDNGVPPAAANIAIAFFLSVAAIIICLPLARAFARRMDRRGASSPISTELTSQLTQLNQAVDAIALEVERISEGQRFTARLLSEQREASRQTLPSGAER